MLRCTLGGRCAADFAVHERAREGLPRGYDGKTPGGGLGWGSGAVEAV